MLKNPEKEILPGLKKRELYSYYEQVSSKILPYLEGRPLTLLRCPSLGDCFIQKNFENVPEFLKIWRHFSQSEKKEIRYVICESKRGLLWLANMACVELNITFSKLPLIKNPDLMIFDLDPFDLDFEYVKEIAFLIKEALEKLGLKSALKTSGQTGLHVVVPIKPEYSFERVRALAHGIARLVSAAHEKALSEFVQISKRKGRVFIDYTQNTFLKTMVAPFSLRPNKSVSMPITWKKLENLKSSAQFKIRDALRLKKDPMMWVLHEKQPLSRAFEVFRL